MCNFIGIDVSKDKLDILVMRDEQEQQVKVENNAKGHEGFIGHLRQQGIEDGQVCLEATGTYYEEVAEALHAAGYRVSVVNPARIKAYARSKGRRNKTDRLDARLLADYARTQPLIQWVPPAPELRELRAMVRRRESLMEVRQQEVNRLKSGAYSACLLAQAQEMIAYLTRQVKAVEGFIRQHIKAHRSLQRLCKFDFYSRHRHDFRLAHPG